MSFITVYLKSAIKKALHKRGIRRQLKIAFKPPAVSILKSIEAEKGKLNPKFRKLSEEYAQDVLGNKLHAPWLTVYSAIAEDFKEGWIPDSYYAQVVNPNISGFYSKIDTKLLSLKLLNIDCMPDKVYLLNGLFYSKTWELLSEKMIEKYLFDNNDVVVYKKDISNQGQDLFFLKKAMFDIGAIKKHGNGVIQNFIRQHDFFNEFMPNSVATLRLTTVVEDNGKVSCRAAYLRLGRNDDLFVMSKTAVKIPVDLKSGMINEKGYLINWKTTNCHPDTKTEFKGKIIPKFNECVEYVIKTHRRIPFCRTVGWDITIDINEKITLMEFNTNYNDIKFSEATQGPCFADMGWEKLWKK